MTGAGLPGADRAVLSRLVARQDDIESTLVQVRGDVDRLTRATAALTETLRRLTPTPPAADDPADDATAGEDGDAGQRDWLTVTDPDDAVAWLVEVTAWWDQVGEVLVGPSVACWPWHPRSVVAALALHAHHAQAYADPRAVAVSDLLTRWTPALGRLISPRDVECTRHEHLHDGRPWSVRPELLPEYAAWWATDRSGLPPGLVSRT